MQSFNDVFQVFFYFILQKLTLNSVYKLATIVTLVFICLLGSSCKSTKNSTNNKLLLEDSLKTVPKWQKVYKKGKQAYKDQEYNIALSYWVKAGKLFSDDSSSIRFTNFLHDLGELYLGLNQLEKAENTLTNLIQDRKNNKSKKDKGGKLKIAKIIHTLAKLYLKKKDFVKADSCFKEVENIYKNKKLDKWTYHYANFLNDYASLDFAQYKRNSEREYIERAIDKYYFAKRIYKYERSKSHFSYNQCIIKLASAYAESDNKHYAKKYFKKSLGMRKKFKVDKQKIKKYPNLYAISLFEFAKFYEKNNEINKALRFFNDAINVKLLEFENNYAQLDTRTKNIFFKESQPYFNYYKKFIITHAQQNEKKPLSYLLNLQLRLKGIQLNNEQLINKYLQRITKGEGLKPKQDSLLIKTYTELQNIQSKIARVYYQSPEERKKQNNDVKKLKQERLEKEKKLFRILQKQDDIDSLLIHNSGDTTLKSLYQIIKANKDKIKSLDQESYESKQDKKTKKVYVRKNERFINKLYRIISIPVFRRDQLCMTNLRYNKLLLSLEELEQILLEKKELIKKPKTRKNKREIWNLEKVQKHKEREIFRQALTPFSRIDSQQEQINNEDISIYENEADIFKKSLKRQKYPHLAFNNKTPKWESIRAHLDKNEAAIDLFRLKSNGNNILYVALIITQNTKTHPILVLLENGYDLENTHYNNYSYSRFRTNSETTKNYEYYWKPIQDKLDSIGGIRRIYFSPDGIYHWINPATLLYKDTQKYIIEIDSLDIYRVNHLKEILDIKNTLSLINITGSDKEALLLGNPDFEVGYQPSDSKQGRENIFKTFDGGLIDIKNINSLPKTQIEIDYIDSLLTNFGLLWKVNKFEKEDATEENLKKISKSPILMHIATHGFYKPFTEGKFLDNQNESINITYDPMVRSFLVFSGIKKYWSSPDSNGDDEILSASEASGLFLDGTELVILSACQSGLGDIQSSEGVHGLVRGFLLAGAKSVMITLWKVPDEITKDLMLDFYKNWLVKKMTKREALKAAQVKILKQGQPPKDWGGFVIVGQ